MKVLQKYSKAILAGILLLCGVLAIMLGKSIAVQFGVGCICWAGCVFVLTWICCIRQKDDLEAFDVEAREILEDIAKNGENSKYFVYYNIDRIENLRKKLIKRQRKQIISFSIIGAMLIIIAIICMI